MKNKTLFAFFLLVSLFLILQQVSSMELSCSNFTGEKEQDCNYIENSGYSYDDEQELLNALWEQDSNYYGNIWHPAQYDQAEMTLQDPNDFLNDSELILASKIFFFGLFNYITFSLTKSNFLAKWLTAA